MQPDTSPTEQNQQRFIPGPPQLPPLVKGQQIKSGPYTITVTDEMVAQRERQNQELYRAWLNEERRRNMSPEDDYVGDFKHSTVRRSFVRKVFCILTLQLLFTTFVIAVFLFVDDARKFMVLYSYLWLIAMLTFIVSFCAISCSDCARRQSPGNYICLFILTLAMSYLTAFASVFYDIEIIFLALGMTTIITLSVSLVATFSKFDLTMRPGLVMVFGLVSIVTIIVMTIILLFTYIKILHLIIAIIGTLILSMYLYFDVQTIMGGRTVSLDPDEVVYATMHIYVDIVLLYKYVLMLMGLVQDV